MLKAIFIDAGHGLGPTGAIDNGASGNGTTERNEVVEIANETIARLKADPTFSGVQIIPVGVDVRLSVTGKVNEVNRICREKGWQTNDALLIAIHINSAGSTAARGLEAWYSSSRGGEDFAKSVIEQVSQATGLPLRAKVTLPSNANRHGRLGIVDDTIPRACLIECGFITNEFDVAVLKSMQLDDRFAEGIHRGIRTYLSLPPTSGPVAPPAFFTDVPPLAWYAGDVKKCFDEGLFKISADGKFNPDRPVTRAELAAVMARHLFKHHGL